MCTGEGSECLGGVSGGHLGQLFWHALECASLPAAHIGRGLYTRKSAAAAAWQAWHVMSVAASPLLVCVWCAARDIV
jgi:hypothetical protein